MIPSKNWFPTNLQDRAAWYENFTAQLLIAAASLGLIADDTEPIVADNDLMQFLAASIITADAYIDAIRTYRRVITEASIGDPTPAFPGDISLTPPAVVPAGMFERLDNLVKRIRVAPLFTSEYGALLGINTGGGPHIPIEDFPPVLTGSVDPGNVIEVKFVKNSSGGIYIETNLDGGGWTFTDKAMKSPAVFSVPASVGNTPRGVQIRARFLDGNSPVGDWSDIVTVQTIP